MSREIKFRGWNKPNRLMRILRSLNCEVWFTDESQLIVGETVEYGTHDAFNEFRLMQFTGLKDKNGVDVYEGDIYCYPNDFPKSVEAVPFEISEVIFIEGAFSIGDYLLSEYKEEGEVIGNIFENPELLEDSYE